MPISSSNTIVSIPSYALSPAEVGDWIPNFTDNTITEIYTILNNNNGDRSSIFHNPVANGIANTISTVRMLVTYLQTYVAPISPADYENMVGFANTTNAYVSFSLNGIPAETSNIVILYPYTENNEEEEEPTAIMMMMTDQFVANGAQTTFYLSKPADRLPEVYVNSVRQQANVAFSYIPQYDGIISKLEYSLLPHTNRLSGITNIIGNGDTIITLDQILSYGMALNTLDGENIANNVVYGMASLFCETDVLKGYQDIINGQILTALRSQTYNASAIGVQLNDIRNGIDNMINSDIDFFNNQVKRKLDRSTFASFVKNMYSEPSGRWIIKNLIGTQALKDILLPTEEEEQ